MTQLYILLTVWALPLTLTGMLALLLLWLCSGFKGTWGLRSPAISYYSPFTKKLFSTKLFNLHAVCIGQVIIARDAHCLAHSWAHECVHVQQSLRYGPVFPLLYCGHSLWCAFTGRHWYWDNYFEQQARQADEELR